VWYHLSRPFGLVLGSLTGHLWRVSQPLGVVLGTLTRHFGICGVVSLVSTVRPCAGPSLTRHLWRVPQPLDDALGGLTRDWRFPLCDLAENYDQLLVHDPEQKALGEEVRSLSPSPFEGTNPRICPIPNGTLGSRSVAPGMLV
jgi:hypothetical protein